MHSLPYQQHPEGDVRPVTSPGTLTDSQLAMARSRFYYSEGPFDPLSSNSEDEDNETDLLLEKKHIDVLSSLSLGQAELGNRFPSGSGLVGDEGRKRRPTSVRSCAIILIIVVLLSGAIGLFTARTYRASLRLRLGRKKITMDHIFNGLFNAEKKDINWVPEVGDGVYSSLSGLGDIQLVDLKTNTTRVLVSSWDITNEDGRRLYWSSWALSPDLKFVLLKTDHRKQWFWSSFGNYYIHDIDNKITRPIIPPTEPPRTTYATCAPTGTIPLSQFSPSDEYLPENNTLELDCYGGHPANDNIIFEVAWVGNASLIIKEINRPADDGNVILFNFDEGTQPSRGWGTVVRKLGKKGEEADDGWVDSAQQIRALPAHLTSGDNAYLDIVPTPEGYNHIALFSPASSGTPHFLTNGNWEVTGTILGVDVDKRVVYFESANPSSIERHIFSVPLPKDVPFSPVEPTPLTDVKKQGYYSSSFSPGAGFYVLNYEGPLVPWQKILKVDNSTFEQVLTRNEFLTNLTADYEAPTVVYSTIEVDGFSLNVQEIRPPRMDDSGRVKYPVLFRVYGGPASQFVDLRFQRTWHDYLACGLSYIVVTVDGRGTGFQGRKLRNLVKGNLGWLETLDQISAAKMWAAKEYVDGKRIGIWGWSYGGYMASKIAEANAGIHSLAMAIAPATDWRLYDSIYTERYMSLPQLNPEGYANASIRNVTGFDSAYIQYLLGHGTGDDNAHFVHSMHLVDMLTQEGIRGWRMRVFPDSDHSISRRGANREVYQYMTDFLEEKWGNVYQ